jgi:hypothetical protein
VGLPPAHELTDVHDDRQQRQQRRGVDESAYTGPDELPPGQPRA